MSRKPVHLTKAAGTISGRDAIWAAIRDLRTFTLSDLEDHAMKQPHKVRTHRQTARSYVLGLEAAGIVQRLEKRPRNGDSSGRYAANQWELIDDLGVDAPRVTKAGKPVTQGATQDAIWQTLRIMRQHMTAREILAQIQDADNPVALSAVTSYLGMLTRAGYLISQGHGHSRAFRLLPIRNTGPAAPQIQRVKAVWDANLATVVWSSKPALEEVAHA